MSVEIARFAPEHRDAWIELQCRHATGDAAQNAEFLAWKYERNPYRRDAPGDANPWIFVALDGGRMVGARGMFPARWEVGPGTSLYAPCAGDAAIDTPHRNRGLFQRLNAAACDALRAEGVRFAFNWSASAPTWISLLAAGWKSLAPLEAWERRGAPVWERAAREALRRAPAATADLRVSPFRRFDRRARRAPDGVRASSDPRPADMAALVERIGHDGRLRHVRDTAWFAWRFRNPRASYRFLYRARDTAPGLAGYLVLRTRESEPRPRVHVVDWEADGESVAAELVDAAIGWGRFDSLRTWTATLSEHRRRLLAERGFRPAVARAGVGRRRRSVLVAALQPGESWRIGDRNLRDVASWDARMSYSDGF